MVDDGRIIADFCDLFRVSLVMNNLSADIPDLLYTSKDGSFHDSFEMSLLDDDEIPFERIPKLKGLIVDSESAEVISMSLCAARLLCSWGDEFGLEFMERLVDSRIDKRFNLNPHRLRNYDTTYEEILDAAICFWVRYSDRGIEKGIWARERVKSLVKKLIHLSSDLPFEIKALYDQVSRSSWPEIVEDVKTHLSLILSDENQSLWKVVDAIDFVDRYDSDFVDRLLCEHGKSRKDFSKN